MTPRTDNEEARYREKIFTLLGWYPQGNYPFNWLISPDGEKYYYKDLPKPTKMELDEARFLETVK